jgi:acyl carrier protein phosphodiesterase
MVANDWLGSYQEFEVLEQVLRGISRRLTRPEELAGAMQELRRLYEPLSEDFALFYPQLQDFAQNPVNTLNLNVGVSLLAIAV